MSFCHRLFFNCSYSLKTGLSLFLFLSSILTAKAFTITIDPGHGGKDPGALGSSSKEKNIVLSVALKLGEKLEKENKDIRVVYTRKSDTFVELETRASIANKAKSDIFVSIHTDAAQQKSVCGAGTFTMGLSKEESNLQVAQRENSIILLEDNYEQRYEGFNPASAESYIMFEFMQDANIDRSILLANTIQKDFVFHKRHDRGVRQAPFWVLHRTGMPSVLIELGFITNPEEERYLKSEKGQNELADCIYRAILNFKKESERKSVSTEQVKQIQSSNTDPSDTKPLPTSNNIVYKIQIATSSKHLPEKDAAFKGLHPIDYYMDKSTYKYTYGSFPGEKEALRERKKISKLFPDAFIIAWKDGRRISMEEARKNNPK